LERLSRRRSPWRLAAGTRRRPSWRPNTRSWKKQLLSGAAELFEDRRGKRPDESAADEQELYEQIGRLKMEVEWLKKKSAQLG
jgi:hypothetical protein